MYYITKNSKISWNLPFFVKENKKKWLKKKKKKKKKTLIEILDIILNL